MQAQQQEEEAAEVEHVREELPPRHRVREERGEHRNPKGSHDEHRENRQENREPAFYFVCCQFVETATGRRAEVARCTRTMIYRLVMKNRGESEI